MKKILFFCFLLFTLSIKAQGFSLPKSSVSSDSLYSKVLGAWRDYTIYLPESYKKDTLRYYPILYMLHGLGETNTAWYERRNFKDVMDLLVSSGEASEMIVVTPNAGGNPETAWSGYFNMPEWNYQDFFFSEFIPYIETTYRVIGDKAHRAITGLSMGGGGATAYAQMHPEMFCACYSMSGLMDVSKDDKTMLENPQTKVGYMLRSALENSCVDFVKLSDEERKELLRGVKWFVDCGDDDFLLNCNLDFFHAMKDAKIPLELRVRDGAHVHEYWHSALYICLPFVTRCFKD